MAYTKRLSSSVNHSNRKLIRPDYVSYPGIWIANISSGIMPYHCVRSSNGKNILNKQDVSLILEDDWRI